MCHVCTFTLTGMSANVVTAEGNRIKRSYLSGMTHSPVNLLCDNVCCLKQYINPFELKPAVRNSLEALDNLPQCKAIFSNHFTLIRIEVHREPNLETLDMRREYASPLHTRIYG